MKNILITGASGFVGRQVLKSLSKFDANLHLVIKKESINGLEINHDAVNFITTKDIFNESVDWWRAHTENIDIVIHLAWYAEPGKYLDSPINKQCVEGTIRMAEGSSQSGLKRFVGIGTCFEYKFSNSQLTTESELKPLTPYAMAKVETFNHLTNLFHEKDMEFLWCRLFYLYGDGEDERRLVPFLINNLSKGKSVELSSGDKIKDYLDVAKAGEIISNLALSDHTGPYNVCSGKGISIKSLAESIADRYNGRDLLKFGNPKVNNLDPDFIVGEKTDPNF